MTIFMSVIYFGQVCIQMYMYLEIAMLAAVTPNDGHINFIRNISFFVMDYREGDLLIPMTFYTLPYLCISPNMLFGA